MKKLYFILALLMCGWCSTTQAQTSFTVLPISGDGFLNDTVTDNAQVTFDIFMRYDGNATYNGSLGYSIFVDSTQAAGNFIPAVIDQSFYDTLIIQPGDTVVLSVVHQINRPPYKLGGNTTVIWPIAGVDELDSLRGDVYIEEALGLLDLIHQNEETNNFKPWPNPAAHRLHITNSDETPEQVWVYDLNGRLVLHAMRARIIDVHALKNGMYVVHVLHQNGTRKRHVFLKRE